MKLFDILPLEKWIEFEKEIYKRSGLNVSVFDNEGSIITSYEEWANELCPVIKGNENGKNFICVAAHNNIALMAIKSKRPITEECDAGLLKLVVPVFIGDELLGVISGCGLLLGDGEVDTFLINKITGIDEEKLQDLSEYVKKIPGDTIDLLINFIEKELDNIIREYEKRQNEKR